MPERVAVLGTGLMGAQIACEYALAGWEVVWIARDQRSAARRIEQALELVRHHDLAPAGAVEDARARMRPRPGSAGSEGPLTAIVESLPEQLELKSELLGELAAHHPQAVIATNTSSISVSVLGERAGVGARIVGTHYWNPPLLMPLVEVVGGELTPPALVARMVQALRATGKRPVVLRCEAPGLLWNRLQLAVLRECLWLVENGVASPETVDEVMRDGLARRWALTGPFETVGLGGAPVFDAIAENLLPVLSDAHTASGFAAHVPSEPGQLATLRERRDAALARQLRAERQGIDPRS